MNSIVDACLKSINEVAESELNAELKACDTLLESYSKAIKLMSCYGEFSIAPQQVIVEEETPQNPQPAQQQETSNTQSTAQQNNQQNNQQQNNNANKSAWEFNPRPDKKDGSGKENIIISILAFIPRLLLAVIKFIGTSIKNLFSGKNQTEQALNNVSDKLDATPDAFKTWALNEDNLAKLIREASGEQNWNLSFKISPTNFKNSAEFDSGKTDKKGRTLYEVWVYPPISVGTVENNLSAFITQVLDPLTKTINDLFIHKVNDEGRQGLNQLKKEDVDKLNNIISRFKSKVRAENEIAKATKETQKSTKNLIVNVKGNRSESETTLAYAVKPGTLYDNLGKISQIIQVMSKRVDGIEALLKKYQESSNKMAPDSPETLENFKKSIGSLKDVASDIITQVRFLSDLATDLGRDAGFVAKQFDNAFNKWQQSNGESGETAEATDGETKTGEGGEINNDAAAEGNSDGVPDEAYDALDERNRRQAIPEALKGAGNAIVGAAKKAGNAVGNVVSNVGSKVKKFISKNPNAIHVVRVKDPTGMDPKFGVARRIEIPEKSIPEFTKKWKNQGFEVTVLESSNLIGIDDDGNRYEITLEEYIENYSDIEIITEQEYLTYYQFENISSLEY